jgi:hypothetical protein
MKDKDGFVRDPNNPGLVINTDNNALKAYKAQKANQRNIKHRLDEIDILKTDMLEIKNALNLILERLK